MPCSAMPNRRRCIAITDIVGRAASTAIAMTVRRLDRFYQHSMMVNNIRRTEMHCTIYSVSIDEILTCVLGESRRQRHVGRNPGNSVANLLGVHKHIHTFIRS
mmetsp:Transcript_17933/g.50926  ORF Transcript_17933/g.50926 Transcript_17933/m.50926 type:complete len:103 (+) Transcript_17933:340-648(+)